MKVKAKEQCYVNNHRRRAGDEFNYTPTVFVDGVAKIPGYLIVLDAKEEAPVEAPVLDKWDHMEDDMLRAKLSEMNIKTGPRTSRAGLLKKLRDSEVGDGLTD